MNYSSNESSGKTASVLNFLATIIFAVLFLIYFSIMAYTKDALWFYPIFDAQPSAGLIRCYGEEITLTQGSEELSMITTLVNEQISGDKRWDELNLSDPTYKDYQNNNNIFTLELYYAEPQRIHSVSPFFSNFQTLLIPLDARHSDTNILFNIVKDKPGGGSFHVTTFAPVIEYIESASLCKRK